MIKKILVGITILIILVNTCIPCSYALEMASADLIKIGNASYHLKYNDRYIICSIIGYNRNGKFYPAYCMNQELPGAETQNYTVNISEVINNDAVWRVVTNGFPYVSAEEMGLVDDFDAYEVTKMAVYCVLGQSDINNFSYDENDITAHRMYDLLVNLVNIGLNRTDITRQTGTMSIEKSGGLVEVENNYYQEYTVSSKINMEKYEITGISNFPERYKNYKYSKQCTNCV
jgi:TQXA domain-containing protein